MAHLVYRKNGHSAEAVVMQADDGKFQGMVVLMPGEHGAKPERLCVPTKSTSYSEALDEAKALAHKTLADR